MALDDFIDDGSSSSSSSSSTSSSKTTQQRVDNSPSRATQAFIDRPEVTPRAIKYQIKSVNANWGYTYSTERFDTGELVMYTAGSQPTKDSVTLAVYTTIQSEVDEHTDVDQHDIILKLLDFSDGREVIRKHKVEQAKGWKSKLLDAVKAFVKTEGDTAIATENIKQYTNSD